MAAVASCNTPALSMELMDKDSREFLMLSADAMLGVSKPEVNETESSDDSDASTNLGEEQEVSSSDDEPEAEIEAASSFSSSPAVPPRSFCHRRMARCPTFKGKLHMMQLDLEDLEEEEEAQGREEGPRTEDVGDEAVDAKSSVVRFDTELNTVHEVVAYSEVYGMHPKLFQFDKSFYMMPARLARSAGYFFEDEDEEDLDSDSDFDESEEWDEQYSIVD